jgi:ketosteroid isomerase-like protein
VQEASLLSIMKASILSIMIVALSATAFADDADLKKQMEQLTTSYVESFNKKDAAGIVALFTTDGIFVSIAGPRTDLMQLYETMFKAGLKIEGVVDQVWPLSSPDVALGMGKFRYTGKSPNGAPLDWGSLWTATYVQEGGRWKVRMLSGIPKRRPRNRPIKTHLDGLAY